MNLSELIAAYGDDKVTFQKLDDCVETMNMTPKGTKASFVTSEKVDFNGFTKLGLVVWLDRDRVAEVMAALKAKSPSSDRAASEGWQPIETEPKDGNLIDVWCVPPEECDVSPEFGGIRLTNVSWHDADEIFKHTGWVRVVDDGHWDLVDGPPTAPHGLPRWIPVHWRPLPAPPAITEAEGSGQ